MMKQTRLNWENKIKHPIKGRLPDEVSPAVKARVNNEKDRNVTHLARLDKDKLTRGK